MQLPRGGHWAVTRDDDGRRDGSHADRTAEFGHEAPAAAADVEPQLDGEQWERDGGGDEPAPTGSAECDTSEDRDGKHLCGARRERARTVRSSSRSRRRSTSASLSGVRARNASIAAAPMATPAHENARRSPSTMGSPVSPHPPCSDGIATGFHAARRSADGAADAVGAVRWVFMPRPPLRGATHRVMLAARRGPGPRRCAACTARLRRRAVRRPRTDRCRWGRRSSRRPRAR